MNDMLFFLGIITTGLLGFFSGFGFAYAKIVHTADKLGLLTVSAGEFIEALRVEWKRGNNQ